MALEQFLCRLTRMKPLDFGEHGRCTSTWINFNVFSYQYFSVWALSFIGFFGQVVGDPGIEPGVRLREGVTVPCHTLRPVAHLNQRIYT